LRDNIYGGTIHTMKAMARKTHESMAIFKTSTITILFEYCGSVEKVWVCLKYVNFIAPVTGICAAFFSVHTEPHTDCA
jgi:hypothetical protein